MTNENPPKFKTIRFNLDIEGYRCAAEAALPDQEITLTEFLPLIWKLQGELLGIWTRLNAAEGRRVSCRAGCGACCRQLVPVSAIEARHLKEVVRNLPEDRRARVLERFAQAVGRLAERGMLEALTGLAELGVDEKRRLGLDYFALGIPCPFLEEESCSIHELRPSSCREYLVTSPAAHCASLDGGGIDILEHAAKFSSILLSFSDGEGRARPALVPLILAMNLAADGGGGGRERKYPAPQLFENFLNCLASVFSGVK